MRFKRCFQLLLISFVIYQGALAQTSTLSGVVKDSTTAEQLLGAHVVLGDQAIITDANGYFKFSIEPGAYQIKSSYVGYESFVQQITVEANQNIELDINLVISSNLMETAVISSSRYEQRIAESVVSIDVIKPDLIENTGVVAIDEVLDKISGVQILQDQANIRGGSGWSFGAGSRVLVMIDDMPALQADAGLAQWDDIPVENVSQVEVLKGAASTLYGSSALNGIIHFRTAYATSDPVTKASIFHTRYGTPKDENKKWWSGSPYNGGASFLHKQKFGKLDLVVGGYYFNQDSTTTYQEDTFRRKTRGNVKLRYRVSDRANFELNTIYNDGSSSSFFLWSNGADGAYTAFPGTITKSTNQRFVLDPSFTFFDNQNNKHKLQYRYYFVNNDNNLNQSNKSFFKFLEYQHTRSVGTGNLATGAVGSWLTSESQLFSDTDVRSRNYALYAQYDNKLFDILNVSFGSRYEYNKHLTPTEFMGRQIPNGEISEGKLISKGGVNLELGKASFIRASWGQGYRFPTIAERFVRTSFGGFVIFANPFLESETGWSSELGIRQGIKLLNFKGFVDLAIFKSQYENMMEFTFFMQDGLSGFQSQNIGDTEINGFEISVAGEVNFFGFPLRVFGGYTFLDPTYQNFNQQIEAASSVDFNILKYRTKHSVSFDLEGTWKNLKAAVSLIGASNMVAIDKTLGDFASINAYRSSNNNGYNRFDTRLSYQLNNAKISFIINNIMNAEYTERPAYLEPPRNFNLRLDLNL